MARKDSDNQKKSMSRLFRGKAIFKPLNTGRIDDRVACVREWVANIFFYTKNGTTIMIDAGYNYARLREKMRRAAFQRRNRLYRRDRKPLSDRRGAQKGFSRGVQTADGQDE